MTSHVLYDGNLRTVCTHKASETVIETDAPVDNQGKGERFSPTDLVATALASCMMTIMGIKARDMELDLKGMKIDVQKIMKADPRRIAAVTLTFSFPEGFEITARQQQVLEKAAHTCPVIYSIHPDIDVQIHFNWHSVSVVG